MRLILSIALVIALMSVGSASAQIVDMNTFTCNDFIGFKRDTALTIVMWLDAYYRDEDDPPIIDFEKMRQKAAMLKDSVANRTWALRRGSRSSTEPPIAKLTMAATSAETGWRLTGRAILVDLTGSGSLPLAPPGPPSLRVAKPCCARLPFANIDSAC